MLQLQLQSQNQLQLQYLLQLQLQPYNQLQSLLKFLVMITAATRWSHYLQMLSEVCTHIWLMVKT